MTPFISKNHDSTFRLGREMGCRIKTGIRIALSGDLGAGKTTFVQGLSKGLGISEDYYITSPTFNILNTYPAGDLTLCHLDLYRLGSYDELEFIGFEDLLEDTYILVVEWPGILLDVSFAFDIEIRFEFDENYNRVISFLAYGQAGLNLINNVIL